MYQSVRLLSARKVKLSHIKTNVVADELDCCVQRVFTIMAEYGEQHKAL
jgi:hypothetical protein